VQPSIHPAEALAPYNLHWGTDSAPSPMPWTEIYVNAKINQTGSI